METIQVRFGEHGFTPKVVVPLRESEKTLAQAVGIMFTSSVVTLAIIAGI